MAMALVQGKLPEVLSRNYVQEEDNLGAMNKDGHKLSMCFFCRVHLDI